MIIPIVLLSIAIIIVAVGLYLLSRRVKLLHNETNTRVSQYYIRTNKEHGSDLDKIHTMILELQVHLENHMKDKLDELEKKIPITNEELLKEVQQMRDDFFALRQNF